MLDRTTVEEIARLYDEASDAEVFGHDFRRPILDRGYLTTDELAAIVTWKTPRQKTNIRKNEPAMVQAVTRQAFRTAEPWLATWILCYLQAVWVRVASAILTVYDPMRYTVIDVRAWEALDWLGLLEPLGLSRYGGIRVVNLDNCATYAAYLDACIRLAQETGVGLRTLDRCLWTMSKLGPDGLAQHGIALPSLNPP